MKNQKAKSANKAVYVDHWFMEYGEPNNDGVTVNKQPNGMWVCELNLPLINKTVKATSKTAINAIVNASNQATIIIDQYLLEHPEIKFLPKSLFHHYEFCVDEYGNVGFRRNSEYRKRTGEQLHKMQLDCSKAVEKAVSKIKRVKGSIKDLFIHVVDKVHFNDDDTIEDIQKKICDKFLGETSDYFISWLTTTIFENCVIAVGQIMED